MTTKLLGVAGSMREGSYSTRAVQLCLEMAAAARGRDPAVGLQVRRVADVSARYDRDR